MDWGVETGNEYLVASNNHNAAESNAQNIPNNNMSSSPSNKSKLTMPFLTVFVTVAPRPGYVFIIWIC